MTGLSASVVQTLVVLLIVASALLYIGRRFWRTFSAARARKKGDVGCAGSCCGPTAMTTVTTVTTREKARP